MLNFLLGKPGRRTGSGDQGWRTFSGAGIFGGMRTQAGPVVDENTALTYAAVWCATRIIAETIGGLPLPVYERTEQSDRRVAFDSDQWTIVHDEPNPKMGNTPFREGRLMHCVNWGNGFAEIERNALGEPVAQWPIHASRVRPVLRGEDAPGNATYRISNPDGSIGYLADHALIHIPGVLS